jgi:hypothetical protein
MPPTREMGPIRAQSEPPTKATNHILQSPRANRVDLLTMSDLERECYMSGYLSGILAGIDVGREQLDNEIAALHRRAFSIVQAMAKLLPWQEAQQARRQHQEKAAAHHRAAGQPWPLEVAS